MRRIVRVLKVCQYYVITRLFLHNKRTCPAKSQVLTVTVVGGFAPPFSGVRMKRAASSGLTSMFQVSKWMPSVAMPSCFFYTNHQLAKRLCPNFIKKKGKNTVMNEPRCLCPCF